jgi:pyruvate formate lyase activating enzyme
MRICNPWGGIIMTGKIHSIETMGLTDGPGIRSVVFFQGCRLRCAYCHNPDTWSRDGGREFTAEELLKKVLRFKPYFERSGGGITCSGGEPLLQPEFLVEFLKLCKENGINTAIDTAGFGNGQYEEVLRYTDLVLLDIKHVNDEGYERLTGRGFRDFWNFVDALNNLDKAIWIRHVVVPGITDSKEHIEKLRKMIKGFNNVKKVELLPYHVLGVNKYREMGIPYRLDGIRPMSKDKIEKLEHILKVS